MRPLLLVALSALSACSGAGCTEYMANTCRLLGGSPDQAALYRSANPGVFIMPVYQPAYQPAQGTRCVTERLGHQVITRCE